jgi:hypothetical protein
MRKIVIMDYRNGTVTIRNVTQKEDSQDIFDVHSDCEYMVVDNLKVEMSL